MSRYESRVGRIESVHGGDVRKVFLCTCGKSIGIDFKKLKKSIPADVVIHDRLCQEEGLARIADVLKGDDQALIACTSKRQVFEALGLNLSFVNLREHCGWVHDRKEATEKAGALVNAALQCPARKTIIEIGKDVLITGELSASMRMAQYLSGLGNVHVLISDGRVKEAILEQLIGFGNVHVFACNLPETSGIKIHAGSVRDVKGRIGEFKVSIVRNPINQERCISCGKCLDACPIHAIRSYPFTIGKECDSCGKCLDACPARAIEFGEEIETIKTGQILAIGSDFQKKKGIYVTENFTQALPAAMEMISNMGRMIEQDKLTVSLEGCASGKSGIAGCTLCENACPHRAISRSGDRIVFDEASCQGCGACAAVCPLSLFRMEDDIYSKMGYLLENSLSPRILMFTCAHSVPLLDAAGAQKIKYPAILPLFVPDLAQVSESHILRAFDMGADGVILMECKECTGHGTSGLADIMLRGFNLDERICVIKNDDSFIESVTAFSRHLAPSPLRKHKPVTLEKTANRDMTLELMKGFAAKTGIVPGITENNGYPFASASIGSKCTVCGACTAMCPTGALRREGGSIRFVYGYCIACGLCEKACPETALKIQRVLDTAKLVDTTPSLLFESELMVCAACKKPYMTAAAFDRIAGSLIQNVRDDLQPQEQVEVIKGEVDLLKYCEACRPAIAISKIGVV